MVTHKQKDLAFNPYMPFWEYVPDAEPHVFGDRLYVYGSHDRRNGTSYCMEDYVVWSAPVDDLSQWRCDGVSFRRTDDPRYAAEGGRDMMAPDVCQGPDGRFYLFYFNDMKTLGVAVSDKPEGPFEYIGFVHGTDDEPVHPGQAFDPGILSDETGNWLYYGFDPSKFMGKEYAANSGCFVVELEDDMLTCKGEPQKAVPGVVESRGTPYEGHAFFEASSVRRINGRYYLVYSSELGHELCYATSESPTGPFAYGGTIVSNSDEGYRGNAEPQAYPANTHGGLVCVDGQRYVFYHRHTHERQYSRQACAEKIEILPDGSIPQVEMTSCGLNDGPLPTGRMYPAHIACGIRGPEGVVHISTKVFRRPSDPFLFQEGSDRNEAGDGCMYAANLQDGAELTFKYFACTGEERNCALTCRAHGEDGFRGAVEVWTLDKDGTVARAGDVSVTVEGGSAWTPFSGEVALPTGTFGIRFIPRGEGSLDLRDFTLA